jgi:hypothetical protein
MNEQLKDQVDMPGYNPDANQGRGDWGLRDVSEGNVFAHPTDIVRCIDHGAMNSVSSSRELWRCLACGRAAYRPVQPVVPNTSTVMSDGTVVPAFAYDNGRSVLAVGHIDTEPFLRDAKQLFESLGTEYGRLDDGCIIRRHALLRPEEDGSLTVMWNVEYSWERVTALTPGAVAVTLTEV